MEINTICVCGGGTMGSGIAQTTAAAGFKTILYEINEGALANAEASIDKSLRMLVEKKKIAGQERERILQNIHFTKDPHECMADFIIEAIVENLQAKISLFTSLSKINRSKPIFATNTSSLSITAIANQVSHSDRVVGMHFFNPAPMMKLVEVVKGQHTSDEVVETVVFLATRLGKIPVICTDSPGFLVNRVARPFYLESLRLLEENNADVALIDELLEATGFKMGPFKLMDLIGNDINYAVSCSVYEQLNKPERLRPSHIQKEKVERGELGKKTGQGYYSYPHGNN
jgi:3-hydroxybutyryl-CoA dehydrogenase